MFVPRALHKPGPVKRTAGGRAPLNQQAPKKAKLEEESPNDDMFSNQTPTPTKPKTAFTIAPISSYSSSLASKAAATTTTTTATASSSTATDTTTFMAPTTVGTKITATIATATTAKATTSIDTSSAPLPSLSPAAVQASTATSSTSASTQATATATSTSTAANTAATTDPVTVPTIASSIPAPKSALASSLNLANLKEELERAKKLARARMIASKLAAMNAAPKQDEFTVTQRSLPGGAKVEVSDKGQAEVVANDEVQVEGKMEAKQMGLEAKAGAAEAKEGVPSAKVELPKEKEKKPIPPLSPESKRRLSLTPYFPHKTGSRNVQRYEKIKRVAHGTYGTVYQAKDTVTQEIVALKKFKMQAVRDGFPKHFLCEINILSCTKHRNLLALREVVLGGSGEPGDGGVFLVLDWMEADMQGLVRDMTRSLRPAEIKCLLRQLLKGVRALDRACIMHRDLKPANLLYNNDNGRLVICDLGEARRYADGDDTESRTPGVMSLRYRAPEVLLGDPHYTLAVDMWSAGGIFAKLVAGHDLLPATTEMELVQMMLSCFGTPTEETWPGFEKLPMANELKLAAAPTGGHLSERFTTTEASGTHKVTPAETPVEKGTEDSQKEGRPDAVPAPLSTPTPATAPTPVDAISIAQTIDAGSATGEQVPKESVLDSFFAEMEEFGEGGEGDNKAKEGAKTAAEEGGQEEQGPVHEGKKVISSEEEKEKPVSVGAALPFLSTLGLDLLTKMLRYDPSKRITAGEALQHAYFMEEPRALPRSLMPKLPC